MITELEKCEKQAKQLPMHERTILIRHLIEGLDELDEQELERLWIREASRRFEEYKIGNIKARPGAEVFSHVRAKLKRLV